jgi:hypothetical protein
MSLGDAVVGPAVKDTHCVQPDGSAVPGNSTAMSDLGITRAESTAEALEAAKACPFFEINAILEVSEKLEMSDTADQPPMENQTSWTRTVPPTRQART